MDKEENYFKIVALSNSSLGWLKESPVLFKGLSSNNDWEERDSLSLERGSLLHLYILEPSKFEVSDVIPITGMMGTFIKEMSKLDSTSKNTGIFNPDDLRKAYEKAGFKISFDKVCEKFMESLNQKYFNFLQKSDGKLSISKQNQWLLETAKTNLTNNKKSFDLLFNDFIHQKNNIEIYTEYPIEFEYQGIKCKAKIDKLFIDHKNKKITLIDLKTTGKSINKFKDAVKYYEYNRQLAWYKLAIQSKFKLDYEFEIFLVAVSIDTGNDEAMVYRIPNKLIESGEDSYNKLINLYKEHLKYGFDFPIAYYLSKDGSVELEYD